MSDVLLNQEVVFRIIDLTGVVGAGALGGTAARQHRFDMVGFLILGICTALGGGILRDLMLNLTPVALTDKAYLVAAVVGVIIATLLRVDERRLWVHLFGVVDAITIGCWAATGATKTLAAGLGVGPALLLGVLTAVGGGVIRDVMVGRTPEVFGGNTLYATPALMGAAVVTIVHGIGYPGLGMIAGTITGIGVCLPARFFKWSLPLIPDFSLDTVAAKAIRRATHDVTKRGHAKGESGHVNREEEASPTDEALPTSGSDGDNADSTDSS